MKITMFILLFLMLLTVYHNKCSLPDDYNNQEKRLLSKTGSKIRESLFYYDYEKTLEIVKYKI